MSPNVRRWFSRGLFESRSSAPVRRPVSAPLSLVSLESRETPAVFTVLNTADSGIGSLREAIVSSNKFPGADTIRFAAGVGGTISLDGEMTVTEPVSIVGPGSTQLTISSVRAASSISRVFNLVQNTDGSAVSLSGLTITGGKVAGGATPNGGAIRNANAVLTLDDVNLDSNTTSGAGGAIALETSFATLTATDSIFRLNSSTGVGGGLANMAGATVSISDSVFSSNKSSKSGGGIAVEAGGTLNIVGSTFAANQAGTATGFIGGGVSGLGTGTITISSSTFSGNSAASGGGVAINQDGGGAVPTLAVNNSTFTLNVAGKNVTNSAGGIAQMSGTVANVTLASTVLAQNTSLLTDARDFSASSGKLNANNSFLGVAQAGLTITGSGNITGTNATPKLAQLGPLQDNGGGLQTHAPQAGSLLINAGSNTLSFTSDQRGVRRVIGTSADIGAVEGGNPFAELTFAPAVDVPGGSEYLLTVTYYASNTNIIKLASIGTDDLTVTGPGGPLTVTAIDSTTQAGTPSGIVTTATYKLTPPTGVWMGSDNGPYTVTINPNSVFDNSATPLPVDMPTFIGKFNVVIPQTFTVTNLNDAGPGSLRDALTQANYTMNTFGLVTADTIDFAPGLFGTINLTSPLLITDSVTILGTGAKLLFLDGQLADRIFDINGPGQIDVSIHDLAIQNGAPAAGHGGGVRIADEVVTLDTVQVISNTTADVMGGGGGIAVGPGGMLRLLNSLVANNTASADGGGLYFEDASSFYIFNSSIVGNASNAVTPGLGGAGIAFSGLVANGTLPTNFVDSELRIINSTVALNTSPYSGGGIGLNISSGSLRATNSTIVFNTALENGANLGGGGIHRTGVNGGILLENTVVAKNTNATAADIGVNAGFNAIISDSSFIGAATGLGVAGLNNQTGTQASPRDPMLGSLTTNGKFSGILLNYEPLAGSPLLDAGNNVTVTGLGLTSDQRSLPFVRTFNSKVDIGAIERQPRPNFGPPTVDPSMSPAAVFTEGGGAVFVDTSLNVFDNVDDPQQFSKIVVTISANYQINADVLSVTTIGSITSSFDSNTGTLTIASPTKDSAANFSSVLATLKFNNTSQAPILLDRTLSITATDATDATIPTQDSTSVTRTVQIVGVNQAPNIVIPTKSPTVQISKPVVISGLSVTDVDAGTGNVTVNVSIAAGIGTFSGVGFTSGNGTNSITVTDTLAKVNTALGSLTFTAGTTLGNHTISITADDNGNTPTPNMTDADSFTIGITTAPPVLTVSKGTVAYTERAPSLAVDSGLVVTDDSTTLGGAFVEITGGFQSLQDQLVLLASPTGGITADTSVIGKITFTGTAPIADYQAILRAVAFKNTSFDPNVADRTITFSVTDPTDPISVTGTRIVTLSAVNDAPSFVNPPTGPFAVATDSKFFFTGSKAIQVTDPDARNNDVQVFLSVVAGQLHVTPSGSITLQGNDTTTIIAKGSVTDVNATLASLYFTAPPNPLSVTLSGGVNDLGHNGAGGAQSQDLPQVNLNVLGAPKVSSMQLLTLTPTKASTVQFLVAFDQPVTGVDIADFKLTTTGLTGTSVQTVVQNSPQQYTVTVGTGTGNGAVRLDLIDNDSITNGATPLGGTGTGNGNFTSGPVANIDRIGPNVTVSLAAGQGTTTKDNPIRFIVNFGEQVSGFDASKLVVSPAGLTTTVTGTGAVYFVSVSGMSAAGTVSVTVPAGVVADGLGNPSLASTGNPTVTFDPNFGVSPPPPPVTPPPPPPPVTPPVTPPPPAVPVVSDLLALAPGIGGGPDVRVFNPNGTERLRFNGGDGDTRNGLSIATGDVNGDGIDDIITGSGPGSPPLVRVFDGLTAGLLRIFPAYAEDFVGGVQVAAGDVTGDGKADIIIGAGVGGGPHIRVFDSTGGQIATFFAYDSSFRGGVNVAVGKLSATGPAQIIAGAGVGGGPHIRTFDGFGNPGVTFFAYDSSFRGGVNVGVADLDGNGTEEILAGAGFGGGPHVRVFTGNAEPIGTFFAYDPSFRGGVRVAGQDTDGDGKDELITAAGPTGGPEVRIFTTSFTPNPPPPPPGQTPNPITPPVRVRSFFAYDPTFNGGVYIG